MSIHLYHYRFLWLIINAAAMDTPFEAVSKGYSEFSREFYKVVSEAEPGNIVSSPMSCLIALAMTHAGAKGDSIQEIARALHLPENMTHALKGLSEVVTQLRRAKKVELSLANKIYVTKDFPILEEYSMALEKYFQVEAENVVFTDPSTADKMNEWVSEQTKNKIKNLVDSNLFDDQTRVVLVNAIYFKGSWLKPFETHKTRYNRPFFTDVNTSVPVPMMFQQTEFNYRKLDELDAQLLILPYQGNDMSMAIILPNKKDGLKVLEEKLATAADLGEILQSGSPLKVEVHLPKFKIETSLDLVDHLSKMGLSHIFSDNVNLSGISTTEDLKVSNVVQKAFIEVSEEGTEAAAATAMRIVPMCRPCYRTDLPTVKCDHPFVFYLNFKSTNVFGGRVTNPANNFGL
ncbi:serpin B4-like [Cloeon dipterum]|uniref:serpin B4-like n=1 Tax=Cloeon dipterum TaxID=197152 RepID=UPI00321F74CC